MNVMSKSSRSFSNVGGDSQKNRYLRVRKPTGSGEGRFSGGGYSRKLFQMSEYYNVISIFVSSGLLLLLGSMLLFGPTAKRPLLGNYRRARYALAAAYLFFAAVNVAEYLFSGPGSVSDVPLIRAVTLAIAASQALLFTLAMLALLETRFPGWRPVAREAAPALLLIAAVFTVYITCPTPIFNIAFWVFAGVYALLLVRYTMLFVRGYRRFRRRMNNYFSDNEADRLRWVAWSFIAALAIGIGALATSVFSSTAVAFGFSIVFNVFYLYFAVRFIGYALLFPAIEEAMEEDAPEKGALPPVVESAAANGKSAARFDALEKRIAKWVADRGYTEKSVTTKTLAQYIGTNDKYVSCHINTCKGKTFSEWINGLRVAEAKRLLIEHPELTVAEVAMRVGIPDKSNFIRQFTRQTHCSPNVWRQRERK